MLACVSQYDGVACDVDVLVRGAKRFPGHPGKQPLPSANPSMVCMADCTSNVSTSPAVPACPLTSPVTLLTRVTRAAQPPPPLPASVPGSSSARRCLLHSSLFTSDQCQPLTFLPSLRSSTIQRGSPAREQEVERAGMSPLGGQDAGRTMRGVCCANALNS